MYYCECNSTWNFVKVRRTNSQTGHIFLEIGRGEFIFQRLAFTQSPNPPKLLPHMAIFAEEILLSLWGTTFIRDIHFDILLGTTIGSRYESFVGITMVWVHEFGTFLGQIYFVKLRRSPSNFVGVLCRSFVKRRSTARKYLPLFPPLISIWTMHTSTNTPFWKKKNLTMDSPANQQFL